MDKDRILNEAVRRASLILGIETPHLRSAKISLCAIYNDLAILFQNNHTNMRSWFQADNSHLGCAPVELSKKINGIARVRGYLQFMSMKINGLG